MVRPAPGRSGVPSGVPSRWARQAPALLAPLTLDAREDDPDRGAAPEAAFDRDPSAMFLHDLARDGQAEPGALDLGCVVGLEDALDVVDAGPLVHHGDDHLALTG